MDDFWGVGQRRGIKDILKSQEMDISCFHTLREEPLKKMKFS